MLQDARELRGEREKASVLMLRLSYSAETVLSNKISRNKIVPSFKDSPRKPLRRRPREGPIKRFEQRGSSWAISDFWNYFTTSLISSGHSSLAPTFEHFEAQIREMGNTRSRSPSSELSYRLFDDNAFWDAAKTPDNIAFLAPSQKNMRFCCQDNAD